MTDTDVYVQCMRKVKQRVGFMRWLLRDNPLGPENPMLTTELVFVQFRKVLELIAFSTLTANRAKYEEAYRNFETHWRAKAMLESVKKLNPEFYPMPLLEPVSAGPGSYNIAPRTDGFLTEGDFVKLYDAAGEILHMRNPFSPKPPYTTIERGELDYVQRIQNLLTRHLVRLVDGKTVWMVTIPGDGEITIQPAEAIRNPV